MTRLTGLRRVFRLMMSYTLCTRRESLAAIAATVPVCAAPITRCSALKTPGQIFAQVCSSLLHFGWEDLSRSNSDKQEFIAHFSTNFEDLCFRALTGMSFVPYKRFWEYP
ncbi:hypothetical protein B0H11DRAFT_1918438 [Mycena galericulata]|nr:hypothetical protein B0H11DRAFT_1918438 [Mycena galericulata]